EAEAATYVSAVIALGELLEHSDTEAIATLVKHVRRPRDSLVPKFAMIALGEIGGDTAFEQLRDAFSHGKRDLQPWAALGLGLHARATRPRPKAKPAPAPQGGAPDHSPEVDSMLLAALKAESRDELRAAIAIGLGLAGTEAAAEPLRAITANTRSEVHKGHLLVALAMLDDKPSIPTAEDGLTTVRDAVYFGHAALALAEFGRRDASSTAVARLRTQPIAPSYVTWLAASAQAVGHLKNAADLPELIAALQGQRVRRLRRSTAGIDDLRAAFAAAAIGSVTDRDPLGFGARVAHGLNYTAREQTISNGQNGILDIF
ncbi:MAG: HEAT repeat domain-containing protein, partial [Planctomycetes bacterium]|nr:HEAT repeat domain-containing protein [Planctomycetota bacterium]